MTKHWPVSEGAGIKAIPGFDLFLKFDEPDEDSAEICVAATIGSRPYTFLLDTGAATTSLIWDAYTSQLLRHGRHQSSGILGDIEDDLVTIRELKVGSLEKETFTVARLSQNQPHARSQRRIIRTYGASFSYLPGEPSDPDDAGSGSEDPPAVA